MVGLFIYGLVALWLAIAVTLGLKLPRWLGLAPRKQKIASTVLVPLLIFLPVMDEVIAYPQIQYLCKDVHGYEFVEGMDERKAHGRKLYSKFRESDLGNIFPSTVKAYLYEDGYFDYNTNEPILYRSSIGVRRGWLGMPAGSSGNAMPVLLRGCHAKPNRDGTTQDYRLDAKIPILLENSNVEIVPTPGGRSFNYSSRRKK